MSETDYLTTNKIEIINTTYEMIVQNTNTTLKILGYNIQLQYLKIKRNI